MKVMMKKRHPTGLFSQPTMHQQLPWQAGACKGMTGGGTWTTTPGSIFAGFA